MQDCPKSSILFMLLAFTMMIGQVHPQVIQYTNYMNYCPMNSNMDALVTESTTEPAYDYTSNFEDANKQQALLMVKIGDGSNDFKFIAYQNDGTTVTRKCTGTANYKYLKLIMDFLFLTSSTGTTRYLCKFSSAADSTPVQLTLTGMSMTSVELFIPYYCQRDAGGFCFVLLVEDTITSVARYNYNDLAAGVINPAWQSSYAYPITSHLYEGVGCLTLLWDKKTSTFWRMTFSTWRWSKVTDIPVNPGSVVLSFPLNMRMHVFAIQTTPRLDKLHISLYESSNFNLPETLVQMTNPSTFDLQYFTDSGYNFMRVSSDEIYWTTLPSTSLVAYYKTSIPSAQLPEIDSILTVGFTKNMAAVYYSSGKMEYYLHVAANQVQKLFYSQQTLGFIDTSAAKQYLIWLKCVCNNISKYSFLSQDLTGLVLNKIGNTACQTFYNSLTWG